MKYAFFIGCLVPARELSYEFAARKILPTLDVELVDMHGANCCAPFGIQSLDYISWLALATRNLCIAEEMGLDILALCSDCYESLLVTNTILKENSDIKGQVNEVLSEIGKEFKGEIEIKHMIDVLYEDVGPEKIKNAVVTPLTDLKVATQPGCHLVRPKMLHFGSVGGYDELDELVRATGAEVIDYDGKEICCGGPIRDTFDKYSRSLINQKIKAMKKANVDCAVTICPFCFLQLDLGQREIQTRFKEELNLPIFHFPELLSIALGFKLTDPQIRDHRISINHILEKYNGYEVSS